MNSDFKAAVFNVPTVGEIAVWEVRAEIPPAQNRFRFFVTVAGKGRACDLARPLGFCTGMTRKEAFDWAARLTVKIGRAVAGMKAAHLACDEVLRARWQKQIDLVTQYYNTPL